MNAPTSASADHAATHATSHPANSAVAHPARIEDGGRSFVTRLASSSIDKLDGLIAELKEMRDVLRFEGERVQREVGNYAQLTQTALVATKAISEAVAPARTSDVVADQAQNSPPRQLSGGREKLKRWPPPAG
ncbi:MAG: hypothetical protein K2Y27_34710 [Xanthobacteraceae bacterium]|nr:hypothetical protein [Xanthobacteraceae bacterium]